MVGDGGIAVVGGWGSIVYVADCSCLAVVWGPFVAVVDGLDVIGSCGLAGTSGFEVFGVTVVACVVVVFVSLSVVAVVVVMIVVVKVNGGCGFDGVDVCGCVADVLVVGAGVSGLARSAQCPR